MPNAEPVMPDQVSPGAPRPPASSRETLWSVIGLVVALAASVWLWRANPTGPARAHVDYSVFYAWVEAGKVKSVVLSEPTLEGELVAPEDMGGRRVVAFETVLPDNDPALLPLLRQRSVRIRVANDGDSLTVNVLVTLTSWLLLFGGIWLWSLRRGQTLVGGSPLAGIGKSKGRRFEKSASVNVSFEDVAGLVGAKRDLQEVVQFLGQPERFRRLGGKVPRGVLLVGPPGTGKTLLARAVAGESGVPFFSVSASEFIEMFVGVGAARVRDLFAEAKKEGPAIIFIDELDAVGRSRGTGFGGGHDEREQTLNQLLSEMDGFEHGALTVVLAATNRPDVLDPALLRPGRFDRRVFVDRPELEARRAILGVHVKRKPLGRDVDLDALAKRTPGFSGADLANLVNEAALFATRRGAEAIDARDFADAQDKIVLGNPREGKLTLEETRRVAVHESGHAVVARFSPDAEPPQRVTVIPRGMALGATLQASAGDRHVMTEPELRARLRVLLGGFAAERLIFGHGSSGTENDLKEATHLATKMVAQWGMSTTLGPSYYDHDVEHPFLGHRVATDAGVSDATARAIEHEAQTVLVQALAETTRLLADHRDVLERLSRVLADRETLETDELHALLDGTSPPAKRVTVASSSAAARNAAAPPTHEGPPP